MCTRATAGAPGPRIVSGVVRPSSIVPVSRPGVCSRYHSHMEFALRSLRLLGFRVFTVLALFAITVLTARWLGPEGRGVYTLVLLSSTLGVTFLGGIGAALAHDISSRGLPLRSVV